MFISLIWIKAFKVQPWYNIWIHRLPAWLANLVRFIKIKSLSLLEKLSIRCWFCEIQSFLHFLEFIPLFINAHLFDWRLRIMSLSLGDRSISAFAHLFRTHFQILNILIALQLNIGVDTLLLNGLVHLIIGAIDPQWVCFDLNILFVSGILSGAELIWLLVQLVLINYHIGLIVSVEVLAEVLVKIFFILVGLIFDLISVLKVYSQILFFHFWCLCP